MTGDGVDAMPVTVRLTHSQSKNRLLQGAMASFHHAGKWRTTIDIRRGKDVGRLSTELPVEPNRSRATLVWSYLALPLGMILLFVAHRRWKRGQNKITAQTTAMDT